MELVLLAATRGSSHQARLWLSRGQGSLFGDLWNLPMREGRGRRVARSLLVETGLGGRLDPRPAAQFEHVLTHRRLQVQLWRVRAARLTVPTPLRLVEPGDLGAIGVSNLTLRCLQLSDLAAMGGRPLPLGTET